MSIRDRALALVAMGALLLSVLSSTASAAPKGDKKGPASTLAGVATTDLSPSSEQLAQGDIYMGGYGGYRSRGPAEGVSDRPVEARALVLRSDARRWRS